MNKKNNGQQTEQSKLMSPFSAFLFSLKNSLLTTKLITTVGEEWRQCEAERGRKEEGRRRGETLQTLQLNMSYNQYMYISPAIHIR